MTGSATSGRGSPADDAAVAGLVDAGRRHQWLPLGQDEGYYGQHALVVTGAGGPYFTDARGDRYLDALCLQSAGVLGHNHPRVVDAMREQLDKLVSNVAGLLPSDVSIELAERLAELTGGELTRCMYLLSGSDANDAAIKLARQYWKNLGRGTKYKTIVRRHGYHGGTLATNAASGNNRYPHSAFEPLPPGFVHVTSPYPRGCELCETGEGCTLACAEEIGRVIAYEDPETVACVLAEPTLAAGGLVPPPPGYFGRLREICDEHDVLLILDEVVTAMGRTGAWFEYQREGIVPDAVVLAKVLTAGHMPLGALLVREGIAAAFAGAPQRAFTAGTTLGGVPLACAAALATIDTIADENLVARATELGDAAEARLHELQQASRIIAEVRVRGALMGIEWVADRETGRPFAAPDEVKRRAIQIGREHGVHFYGGPAAVLLWIPPSNIDSAAMDHLMTTVERVVSTIDREFAERTT